MTLFIHAIIVQHNGKVYVESTRELYPNKEILISYEGDYWADRLHLYPDTTGKHPPSSNFNLFVPTDSVCSQTDDLSRTKRFALIFPENYQGWTFRKM